MARATHRAAETLKVLEGIVIDSGVETRARRNGSVEWLKSEIPKRSRSDREDGE